MTNPRTPDGREVLPGTIGLTAIAGEVGELIHLGQYLAETPIRDWLKENDLPRWEHAFVYLGDGQLIEAEPGGARIMPITEYGTVYWCMSIAGRFSAEQLAGVADRAHTFEGTKYSFLDYFALAGRRLHLYPLYPLLRLRIESTRHVICSQLADAAYRLEGLSIFPDDRWAGDVMPMDLYRRDLADSRAARMVRRRYA